MHGEKGNLEEFWLENMKGKDNFKELGLDRRMLLK
jgi:hypothetical protein